MKSEIISELGESFQNEFKKQRVILSFGSFLELLEQEPQKLIRNAASYIKDTFDYFGMEELKGAPASTVRYKLFDIGSEKNGPIIGCESVQGDVYSILDSFVRQGFSDKLILLHGPNGSAKTTTIEAITYAMQRYSYTDDGAVYTFNWIFPTEKSANPMIGEGGPIGFGGGHYDEAGKYSDSYALLDESKVASRIQSEFRDNPIFLIPMPQRERLLRQWIAKKNNCDPGLVELPPHVLMSGLSKKNQLVFENLLNAYNGDFSKVLRHVQVERFYYSRQYRVGIATIEPQMSIDAQERQLTMDKNIANLPAFLHNIRFHEASGELVEANRGLVEFSDMLKRPIEAFKYLLTTIERGTIHLPSSTAQLDVVFFGTTNEKHLDAFKTIPDFSSFRSRFEFITVPYLTNPYQEEKIYEKDIKALSKLKRLAPHTLRCLCRWAVMTRLKQPDPEHYEAKYRSLITRLDPLSKMRLYAGERLQPAFRAQEETMLRDLRTKIMNESKGVPVYEGRFGASPREVKGILNRAAKNPRYKALTPMAIFDELRQLVRDKTVYEFLQFEPRGHYHDVQQFIVFVEAEFAQKFELEVSQSMSLVSDEEYDRHLQRYIEHVVAYVKGEKIYNKSTSSYEPPSQELMREVERILGVTGSIEKHRQQLLSTIGAYKINNPDAEIDVKVIFEDLLKKIERHYHKEKREIIDRNFEAMLALGTDSEVAFSESEKKLAESTFSTLKERFGYDRDVAMECLKFLIEFKKKTAVQ